jgi:PAS domain S-box-containing protein
LLGYRPDELIGMHSHKIVHESHLARAQEFSRRNDKTARYSTECNLKHKDGHAVPVILAAAPIRDESGQIHDRFAFVTDVSEQKKHEMELARA